MKNYTDIEQSKKLAEILPPESADMSYTNNKLKKEVSANLSSIIEMQAYFDNSIYDWDRFYELTPCWSLAALVAILPVSCDDGQHCFALINSNPNGDTEWLCCYEDDNGNLLNECYADNPVDACVELIIKLHEQKLL